jgi:putative ABC transport system permease protein
MKYLPLIWAGLWRKPVRTVLTLLSVVVAFTLFGLAQGIMAGLDALINQMSDTRLRVQSRVNITEPLPYAYLSRIESVPGVQGAGFYNFFAGYYQEPNNSLQVGAMDMSRIPIMFPEIAIPPEQVDTMLHTRNGALIGRVLAEERGWKIGDDIPLRSNVWTRKDGAPEWIFKIVGIYEWKENKVPSNEFWINYDYFDEARAFGNGTVTLYFARITDPARSAQIADAIDGLFANSPFETQTQNERDWIRGRINQTGDIAFFINGIIAAVMVGLLFLTFNTMVQSVRERTSELAVLKTYGYSNAKIVGLVLVESLVLCVGAAMIGVAIAAQASPIVYRLIQANGISFPSNVFAIGAAIAALVAFVSGALPAWRAQRLDVVHALAAR